jgi:predicted AlkP superfamily phosphohydrolase/phosphomutase
MPKSAPCVMIGWDGATFDLLSPWVEQGLLPNLGRMLAQGSARRLRSIIPPISPAAWASIMTGMNPGKHGILDFQEFNPSDYVSQQPNLINSTHFAGSTILDILSERGLRVCSLQIPMTYPVWPVNGLLLAGVPNPDDSIGYAYPADRNFGAMRPSKMRRQMSYAEVLENCTFHIRKLTDIFLEVLPEKYDFYTIYYRECDDFHHLYWRLLDEKFVGFDARDREEMGNPILTIYKLLDVELGRLMDGLPEANFFLISDHGGTAIGRRRLFLNSWLAEKGFLRLNRTLRGGLQRVARRVFSLLKPFVPKEVRKKIVNEKPQLMRTLSRVNNSTDAIAWEGTRAFAIHLNFPTMGVQLNVRGREKTGIVEPGAQYEQVRDELMAQLKTITDPTTGRPVVKEIYRREELISGPYLDRVPDILMLLDTSVLTRTEIASSVWGDTTENELHELSGDHDLYGIFAASGPDVCPKGFINEAHLLDVAPTMLASLGESIPANMDGHVMEDIFQESFLRAHPPAQDKGREVVAKSGEKVYSPEEEAAVRERLESLGYLEG